MEEKHLALRFKVEYPKNHPIAEEFIKNSTTEEYSLEEIKNSPQILKDDSKSAPIIIFDNGIVQGFHFNDNGKDIIIPEPDIILIYFSQAESLLINLHRLKKCIRKMGADLEYEHHNMRSHIYTFYSQSYVFITCLHSALEAFTNQKIPRNYTYTTKVKGKTVKWDKEEIEKKMSLSDKWKYVLKDIYKKNFNLKSKKQYQKLIDLKNLRNDLVHLKTTSGKKVTYDSIFERCFKFEFENSLNATMDFINFFHPSYIEYCDCKQNANSMS